MSTRSSETTRTRKPAGRGKATEKPRALSPTEEKDRSLARRPHKEARKRSERLRDAVFPAIPAIGATNAYFGNPLSYYSGFPVYSPSMYPPYNPPGMLSGVPPCLPLALQYPVLPPIPPLTSYERDRRGSSSEQSDVYEVSPPAPYTSEELSSAAEDVCSKFIETALPTLVMEIVCGCIEEIVKSYLKQSKLLIEPPIEVMKRAKDPLMTPARRRSVPLPAAMAPPFPSAKLPTFRRSWTDPISAQGVASRPQVKEGGCVRFAPESINVTQFDSEAELCRHMAAKLMDHLLFVHLLEMAMDGSAGALMGVACEGVLYDMMMKDLLNKLL